MAYNYKQQVACQEIASALSARLNRTVVASEVSAVPVVLVGPGTSATQSASVRIQNQRGDNAQGWQDGIQYGSQSIYTTGVAQILVENAGPLPANVLATDTVTFASFVANDTVTVNGTVFTGVASPASAVQFKIGATDMETAANFAAVVNAHPVIGTLVTATAAIKVVTLTSDIVGGAGNRITLAISAHGSVGGATFTGGAGQAGQRYTFNAVVATNTVVINGVTLTADAALQDATHFTVGANDTATVLNAVTAIAANTTLNQLVYGVGVGPYLFVIAKAAGTMGNLITTTGTALRTVPDAATLTGGAGGLLSSTLAQADINTIVCECGIRGLKVEFWAVPGGTAPVFANIGSATQFGEFDVLPYWPLSGRV